MTTSSASSNASSTVGRCPQEQALAVCAALRKTPQKNRKHCERRTRIRFLLREIHSVQVSEDTRFNRFCSFYCLRRIRLAEPVHRLEVGRFLVGLFRNPGNNAKVPER